MPKDIAFDNLNPSPPQAFYRYSIARVARIVEAKIANPHTADRTLSLSVFYQLFQLISRCLKVWIDVQCILIHSRGFLDVTLLEANLTQVKIRPRICLIHGRYCCLSGISLPQNSDMGPGLVEKGNAFP